MAPMQNVPTCDGYHWWAAHKLVHGLDRTRIYVVGRTVQILHIVFCRCVRPDETSQTLRCHYMRDGTVNVALTIRRAEYFIPAAILLKAFLEVSDLELFRRLAAYAPTDFGMELPMSASWVGIPKLSFLEIQVRSVCRSVA